MLITPVLTRIVTGAAAAGLAALTGVTGPPGPTGLRTTGPPPPASALLGSPVSAPRGAWRWPLPGTPDVVHPFAAPPGPYAPGHRGVDLAAAPGTTVLAPAPGTVAIAGRVAGVPVVVVAHAGGLRSTLQPVTGTVPVGTSVVAGQVVGRLAPEPGHCDPAGCLHWGVLRGATYLDPVRLLRPPRVVLLPWS